MNQTTVIDFEKNLDENRFHVNLTLMAISMLLFSFLDMHIFRVRLFSDSVLLIVLFFLISQFYLNRWSFKYFALVYFLTRGFNLTQLVEYTSSYSNSDPLATLMTWNNVEVIVFLIPAIFVAASYKKWFKELTTAQEEKLESHQNFIELIPVGTTFLIGIISLFRFPLLERGGLQSLFLFSDLEFDIQNFTGNLLSKGSLIFLCILVVVYLLRKNRRFGFMLLAFYALNASLGLISSFIEFILYSGDGQNFHLSLTAVGLEVILPIIAFVLFYSNFNKTGLFANLFKSPVKEDTFSNEAREEYKIDDFINLKRSYLNRDNLLLLIVSLLPGFLLMLVGIGAQGYKIEFLVVFLGLVMLGLSALNYFLIKGFRDSIAIFMFITINSVYVILLFVFVEELPHAFRTSMAVLIVLSVLVSLIQGIPLLRAISSEEAFVNYVQNRDGSRIFNQLPSFRIREIGLKQSNLDKFSNELLPWKTRKVRTIIFLSLMALNMMAALYVLDLFRFHGFDRSYVSTLAVCGEAFLLMLLFFNLVKWGLYLNRVYVICFMLIYFISAVIKIPDLLETSVAPTKDLISFGFMIAVAIFFLDALIKLEKRKKDVRNTSVSETDLLDD